MIRNAAEQRGVRRSTFIDQRQTMTNTLNDRTRYYNKKSQSQVTRLVSIILLRRHGYIAKAGCHTFEFVAHKYLWGPTARVLKIYYPSLISRPKTRTVRATIVLGRNKKTTRFKQTMNNGLNLIKSVDVERAYVAALSNELFHDLIYTTTSEDDWATYGIDSDVLMTIAKIKIRDFIAEKSDRIFAEHTQVEFLVKTGKTLVEMLQLCNNAASSKI